ncbi:MAG: C-terminal binding protein [Planctomycetota bacterium]|nr:C-terminal binding protein [Planctomycetota bacterium]
MKVLVTDYAWPDLEIERAILGEAGIELIAATATDPSSLAAQVNEVDGILACWASISREVIENATRCRIVARMGIGLDNIDVQQCTEQNILVTNVPDYCAVDVAEHTLALLLAMARNIPYFHQQAKTGNYQLKPHTPLRRLAGQRLGIVGWGAIGQQVARRAQAMGLDVVVTRHNMQQPIEGFALQPLETLLATSDYVSLHLPYNKQTHQLLNTERLRTMKPTAFLINTARGGLVDHDALLAALESNQLAGAALDVHDPEPPDLTQPLYQLPQVVVTPHAAFYSEESLRELRTCAATQVVTCLQGLTPEHVVNPEIVAN